MTRPSDIPEYIFERAELLCDQFRHIEDDREFVARILMEAGQGPRLSRVGLTKAQMEALAFIEGYQIAKGYSPSYREIGQQFDIGLSRVSELVKALDERGFITSLPNRARSIAVVGRA